MIVPTVRVDYLQRNLPEGPYTVQIGEDVARFQTLTEAVGDAVQKAAVASYWVSITQSAVAHGAERTEG